MSKNNNIFVLYFAEITNVQTQRQIFYFLLYYIFLAALLTSNFSDYSFHNIPVQ